MDTSISSAGALPPPEAIFPHPKDWNHPSVHGKWVNQNSHRVCLKCHTVESAVPNGAASCHSCHALYPHEEGWLNRQEHGDYVVDHGQQSCATQCHGADLNGGLSDISCSRCHRIFPHPAGWAAPAAHGPEAEGGNKNLCKGCHGDDFSRKLNNKNCFDCHLLFPHEAGWADDRHGDYVAANGAAACAGACHGADLRGGLSQKGCDTCHMMMPHPAGWGTLEGHGQYVLTTLNRNLLSCQICHGADYRRTFNGKNCFSCHPGYPHTADWGLPSRHGPMAYGLGKQGCATSHCHGTRFEGNAAHGAPSCTGACHGVVPHPDYPHDLFPKWMTLEKRRESLRDESFHGDRFIRKLQRGEASACGECHGANYDRTVGGAACTVCHTGGVTHRTAGGMPWAKGAGHGAFFSARFDSVDGDAGCQFCHGTAIDFTNTQTRQDLENAAFCYRCHPAYPHTAFNTDGDNRPWAPVVGNECGQRQITNWGHVFALMNGPLFTDVRTTCAGSSAGSCHSAGLRAYWTGNAAAQCAPCHAVAGQPSPPELPDCEAPPAGSQIAGAPRVVFVSPQNGAVNVATTTRVTANFNEAMQRTSITQGGMFTVRKRADGTRVDGNVTCSGGDWCRTATWEPRAPLFNDTEYEARLSTEARDWGGEPLAADYLWTFRIAAELAPTVASTSPVAGESEVSFDLPFIEVQFSEPMQRNSIRSTSIALTRVLTGENIAGTVGCVSADCRIVRFTLPAPRRGARRLFSNEEYRVTVSRTVRDTAGVSMAADYVWTFRTMGEDL